MQSTEIIAAQLFKPGNYNLYYDFGHDGAIRFGEIDKIALKGKKEQKKIRKKSTRHISGY